MGAADGAAEEHRGGTFAKVGEELLELDGVVAAAQLALADLADEGGCVVAVDEQVRILPGVEAGGAAGDLVQDLRADAVESHPQDLLLGEGLPTARGSPSFFRLAAWSLFSGITALMPCLRRWARLLWEE